MTSVKGSPLLASVESLFENTESIVIAAFQVSCLLQPWHLMLVGGDDRHTPVLRLLFSQCSLMTK